jgi:hypothetical protein
MLIHSLRQAVRILCALGIALVLNYYFLGEKQGWLPFTTVMVMLTTPGSALYQGLLRFFFIAGIVTLGSFLMSPIHLLYLRLYDISGGALIGILVNMSILPDRVDRECRHAFILVLKSYASYFSAIIHFVLKINLMDAEREKIQVEKTLQKLPTWIYETGFDMTLQKSYRYFFMKIEQLSEILFAMHHVARSSFSQELLNTVQAPLLRCAARVESLISLIITVLDLKELKEGIVDFSTELEELEEKLQKMMPPLCEDEKATRDMLYLMEFMYGLQDLRNALLRLTDALSTHITYKVNARLH